MKKLKLRNHVAKELWSSAQFRKQVVASKRLKKKNKHKSKDHQYDE
jgi:hypothetical protein